ncbi:MAG: DUF342 domain-containing protein [Planctomycetota bacterium]|nr:MAG: DUF342 domain-containing protein [Planctomycetota bacterium]
MIMNKAGLPERIGPYRVLRLLGQGGMGAVYAAVPENGGDEVALKVMRRAQTLDEKRFLAEARMLQRIDHPQVIRCLDVGSADDGLYMVLELMPGGDARALMERHGGRLKEMQALRIMQDVARGLEALEESGLVHRDIKPDNIFLRQDGRAVLADFGVVRALETTQALTMPGVPVGTVAYMAPEQAEARGDIDTRADIYGWGATLYAMLSGRPPFLGENPMMTMLMVVNQPFPDLRKLRPDCSSSTIHLINRATMRDPAGRYQHARELREAVAGVIEHVNLMAEDGNIESTRERRSRRGRQGENGQADKSQAAAIEGKNAEEVKEQQRGERFLDNLDQAGLNRVMTRVRIAEDGLCAWINLAPETSFPSVLLRAVLHRRGVIYGLREGAILDASRSGPSPRRVVVAAGDRPSPGFPGRDIYGQVVPPLPDAAIVTVSEDATEAWLLTPPGKLPTREEVQRALVTSGVRFGILRDALALAWEGPPPADGRRLVAKASPLREAMPPCFILSDQHDAGLDNLAPVQQGEVIARWNEGSAGSPGMDVCGRPIPVAVVQSHEADVLAGEGTDISRDSRGRLLLRASRHGHVQRRVDGVIRVVNLVEVNGDLEFSEEGLSSDDVVVVHGSVRAGARISCSNDVVIEGDLEDASVDAGGSIEVQGNVLPGGAPVIGVDAMAVQGSVQRRVVAGNLRVAGKVEHCELVATGDITAQQVIGGSVTAGGSVRVAYAGDDLGTTTELWAGRNLPYDDQERLARLAERRLAAERNRLVEECKMLAGEVLAQEGRTARMVGAVNHKVLLRHQQMLEHMEERWREAESLREDSRRRLADQRQMLRELGNITCNQDCSVEVSVLARPGVVARIADADPLRLRHKRHRLRLRLDDC